MTPAQLFQHVLADLDGRVTLPANDYAILRASGLIRLLLTDAEPLVRKVADLNAIRFRVHQPVQLLSVVRSNDPSAGLGGGIFLGHTIYPSNPTQSRELGLEAFLGHSAASSSWTGDVSVKEVLRVATIAFGGVHLMTPNQQRDQDVSGTFRMIGGGDVADVSRLVQEIGAVTVDALTPLLVHLS